MNGITVIDSCRESLLRLMEALSPVAVRFVIQLDALVLIPIVFCGVGYLLSLKSAVAVQKPPSPNIEGQVLLCVSGWIAAILLPVSHLSIEGPSGRLWLVTMSIFVLIVGVRILGYLLGFPANYQKSTTLGMYAAMILLCLWQIFWGDWHQ